MAAPSGTIWGPISGKGRLGLYITTTSTATQTTATIDIWIYTQYSTSDSSNTLYYDDQQSNPTTNRGSVSVNTTSNNGWNVANQQRIKSGIKVTHTRGTSDKNWVFGAKLTGVEYIGATLNVSATWKAPALQQYSITYNANGGSGAPGKQTKFYGKNVTISSTRPTRTGYSFQGWSTANDSSVEYSPGATYTGNANLSLYAVWKANTYTVSYNANGGSGAPGAQTKTYGVNLTLSSTKPTRANYNFLGWATSPSGTSVAYAPGATYTSNSSITLYAIWSVAYVPPRVTGISVDRCTSNGTLSDEGTYARVKFSWSTDKTVSSIRIYWGAYGTSSDLTSNVAVSASGTSGTVTQIVNGSFSTEKQYRIGISVVDSAQTYIEFVLPSTQYIVDFKAGGKGMSVGKVAELDNYFDVYWPAYFRQNVRVDGILQSIRGGYTTSIYSDPGNAAKFDTNAAIFSFNKDAETAGLFYDKYGEVRSAHRYTANHNHEYALSAGSFRLQNGWMGLYGAYANATSHTSRKGWIGHDGGTNLNIRNEAGGVVSLSTPGGTNVQISTQIVNRNGLYLIRLDDVSNKLYLGNPRRYANEDIQMHGYTIQFNGGGGGVKSNQTIQNASDRRLKENIKDVPDEFVEVWKDILPKVFTWNEKSDTREDRIQFGVIAQDVISAFENHGLDYKNYGIIGTTKITLNGEEYFTVSYDHYHMLTSLVVRKQQKEIDELKSQVNELKELVTQLLGSKQGGGE